VNALSRTKHPLQENVTRVTMTAKTEQKNQFAKSDRNPTKSGQKSTAEDTPKYCTHCKTGAHNTEKSWKLKKIAREKELSYKKAPYLKQIGRQTQRY
jgi:hypothetical protein